MIDDRSQVLTATVEKLYRRGAMRNVQRVLNRTHTADIASMLEALEPEIRLGLFKMQMTLDKKAEVISYLKANIQEELLSAVDRQQAQQIVSRMDSDDAADLLSQLPEEMSKEILKGMVQEDSVEVQELMGYPDDSAGGLMSPDFFALNESLSVVEAIKLLQSQDEDASITFYVYVTNDQGQLVGVLSLKQLLLSRPTAVLKDIMSAQVISVSLETNQQEVARIVERYDFLSLPVVDEGNKLVGVITVDDVIDVIREEAEEDFLAMGRAGFGDDRTLIGQLKARVPWLLMTFLGGVAAFSLIYFLVFFGRPELKENVWWMVAAFTPLILSMGATTGNQAAVMAVGTVKAGGDMTALLQQFLTELKLCSFFAAFFALLIVLFGWLAIGNLVAVAVLACALALQIILAVTLGSSIPMMLRKIGLDPTVATIPLFTALADILAVTVLFGLARVTMG